MRVELRKFLPSTLLQSHSLGRSAGARRVCGSGLLLQARAGGAHRGRGVG